MIDPKLLADHNLTREEYDRIVELIGREPNITELGIFSTMWSEHCSYKSSKVFLKRLPTRGKHVIQGPGRKRRHHRHRRRPGRRLQDRIPQPSLLSSSRSRARPPASAGSSGTSSPWAPGRSRSWTRSGSVRSTIPRNRAIMEGVVSGISSYGNSFGVPTVGGEVYFQEGYAKNPLVNVFCLGLVRKRQDLLRQGRGHREPRPLRRLEDGPGRHPRGDHGLGGVREGNRAEAAERPGRRPVQGEAAARGLPRSHGPGADHRHPGHGRGRPDLLDDRDGRQGRKRHRHRPRPRPAAGRGHDALRDHAVRIAGEDAPRLQPREAWPRSRPSSPNGTWTRSISARSPAAGRSA